MAGDARAEAEDRSPAADLRGLDAPPLRADRRADEARLSTAAGRAPLPAGRGAALAWVDDALVPAERAALRPDDGAWNAGLGCYTTARASGGAVRWGERHVARLRRDAARLGVGPLDSEAAHAALRALAREALGGGEGAVRLQASRDGGGPRLVGTARPLAADPPLWRAVLAPFPHAGPGPLAGVKASGDARLGLARAHAARRGLDELLLLDTAGRLVEGARTTPFVVLEEGRVATPPLARGGVAGLARALVLERLPGAEEAEIPRAALASARAVVLVNAVRGARPLLPLPGARADVREAEALAARLRDILDAAD